MRMLLVLLMCVMVVGCATASRGTVMNHLTATGKMKESPVVVNQTTKSGLFEALGPPDSIYELEDGREVFVYRGSNSGDFIPVPIIRFALFAGRTDVAYIVWLKDGKVEREKALISGKSSGFLWVPREDW